MKTIPNFSRQALQDLNNSYRHLSPEQRLSKCFNSFPDAGILLTSSFGSSAAVLLKLVSEIHPGQEIFFIDTGFHFPETISYKNYLIHLFDLKVTELSPEAETIEFIKENRLWEKDPQHYSYLTKVKPLESVKRSKSVWISGLMAWQTEHRANLDIFEIRDSILKFHPLLDISEEDADSYFKEFHLPYHPLVFKGYDSIGCIHTTSPGKGRSGRWAGSSQTECGLHL